MADSPQTIRAGSDVHAVGSILRTSSGNLRVVKVTHKYGYVEYEVRPVGVGYREKFLSATDRLKHLLSSPLWKGKQKGKDKE